MACQPCAARRAQARAAAANQRRVTSAYVVQDPDADGGEVVFAHLVDARMYQRKKGLAPPTVRP